MKYNLKINCHICQNSVNSLIDLEADKSIPLRISVDCSGYLYQKTNKLLFSRIALHNAQFLCRILPHKDTFEIDLDEFEDKEAIDLDDVPWIISRYVFNSPDEQGYILHEGDLIKMGKYILKVRQMKLKRENMINTMIENQLRIIKDEEEDISRNLINPKEVSTALKLKPSSFRDKKNSTNMLKPSNNLLLLDNRERELMNELKPVCRICLSDNSQDANDPLITPCKCSGTMKYLHLMCLRKFIESKIHTVTSDNVTMLSFKSIECDICKTLFPEKIKVKDTSYFIVDLHRPLNNYLIIEATINEVPEHKKLFIIDFKTHNSIKIGRGSGSDIKLGDISVSRNHAEILLKNNGFQLIDNKSKFGTLISSSQHLSILPLKPLVVQKRLVQLKFNMTPKLCTTLSCYHPTSLPYKTYNEYLCVMQKFKRPIKEMPTILLTETQTVAEYDPLCDKGQQCTEGKINKSN